ncbi:GNAT family N-acetyltransferase [Halopseudomonas pelagia]|uniref:GNAT family N-acetyltransferase n=1 Tax=Halopseudomonas pelagia TaxID=553151 RepID=UPI0003A7659D|nr:GNAT family N-acetyltransferase [Halopseudomonas pelagia]|tara:strand:- start:1316 stop:2335 length:1020 start_codon:yes stop_codon:yes gene_type:complete
MNEIDVSVVDWLTTAALRDIRTQVFIDEQGVPEALEWDADDQSATHFLMCAEGEPLGTARLLDDGHIGRVAVLPAWRGKGLGERLMREVMAYAQGRGMDTLLLSAQVQAQGLYQRLGFINCSQLYMEAGIPHIAMRWQAETLAISELPAIEFSSPGTYPIHNPPAEPRTNRAIDLPYQLGDQRELVEVNESTALDHVCLMLSQAQRQVIVYAADQAVWMFNRRDVLNALEQLIGRQPKCRIRVLLQEAGTPFLQGHSLVNLMHRFPSLVDIRKQHPDREKEPHVYMLVDNSGVLMLPKAAHRQGFARYHSPDQVRRWGRHFDELWATSQSDSAIRRFLL